MPIEKTIEFPQLQIEVDSDFQVSEGHGNGRYLDILCPKQS